MLKVLSSYGNSAKLNNDFNEYPPLLYSSIRLFINVKELIYISVNVN